MAAACLGVFNLCAVRITRLFEDGEPDFGADAYSIHVPVSIAETVNTYEVAAVQQADGCGDLCIDVPAVTTNTGYGLVLSLCPNDYELFAALSGGTVITNGGGDVIGYNEPAAGTQADPVCIEGWQLSRDGDNVGTLNGTQVYKHRVWPFSRWSRAGITMEQGPTLQVWNGTTGANNQIGATGPFGDWPDPVNGIAGEWWDEELPAAFCGMASLLS